MTDISKGMPPPDALDYSASVGRTAVEVSRLLKSAPALIRHMTSYLAKAAGKMIRARALLACALREDGSVVADAVKAAAAVELFHLATLIHDDIIDDADKRRGIDALHRKFGEKYAVLCGDWLLCAALELISTAGEPELGKDAVDRSLPRYLTEVCLGELRQDQNHQNFGLSEREYFRIIRGKTAALFEASCYAGFMLSGERASSKDIYKDIGNTIGIIFQLSDDCADYETTMRLAKKPVLSDYSRGVVTLPLIHALGMDKTLLERIKAGMDPAALKNAVTAAGGLAYAHSKIDRLYKKTTVRIDSLDISAEKKALMRSLLCQACGNPA